MRSLGTRLEFKVQLLILDFRSVEGIFLYKIPGGKSDVLIFKHDILHIVLKSPLTLYQLNQRIFAFTVTILSGHTDR